VHECCRFLWLSPEPHALARSHGFEHSPSAGLNGHPLRDEAFCRGQFIRSSMPATEVEALLRDTQCLLVPSMVACMPLAGCLSQQLIYTDTYDYLTHIRQLRCADVTAKKRKLCCPPVKSSFVRSAMRSQLSRLRRARLAARTRHT
jgi:hypothetical protein